MERMTSLTLEVRNHIKASTNDKVEFVLIKDMYDFHKLNDATDRMIEYTFVINDPLDLNGRDSFCKFEDSVIKQVLDYLVKLEGWERPTIKLVSRFDFAFLLNDTILQLYPDFRYTFTAPEDKAQFKSLERSLFKSKIKSVELTRPTLELINAVLLMPRIRFLSVFEFIHVGGLGKCNFRDNYTLFGCHTTEYDNVAKYLIRNNNIQTTIVTGVIQFLAIKKFNRSDSLLFTMDRNIILKIAKLIHDSLYEQEYLIKLSNKI